LKDYRFYLAALTAASQQIRRAEASTLPKLRSILPPP
jgi:hypothetical protein